MCSLRFVVVAMFVAWCAVGAFAITPSERDEYERLGLSQTEWETVVRLDLSKDKVYELLKCGISIGEYANSTWKNLGISEGEWIDRRRNGESNDDIRHNEITMKEENKRAATTEWVAVQSFFLPGAHQIARQRTRGWIMTGLAIGGITLCAVQSAQIKKLQPLGLFILVPAMAWSGIDMNMYIQREQNPDAQRFMMRQELPPTIGLSLTFQLP